MSDQPPLGSQPEPGASSSAPYAPTDSERSVVVLAHIGQLIGVVAPPLFFVAPLIAYLTRGKASSYVRAHAVEALNFSITVGIAYAVVTALGVLTFGLGFALYFLPGLWLLIWPIVAAVKASNDRFYYYPLTLRLMS